MITKITNALAVEVSCFVRLPGATSDVTFSLPPGVTVPVIAERVVYSSVELAPSALGQHVAYLTNTGPVLGPASRPGSVDGVTLGIWTLVFVYALFKVRPL